MEQEVSMIHFLTLFFALMHRKPVPVNGFDVIPNVVGPLGR